MKSKMLSVWVALIVLTVCVAPVWAQRRVPEFRLYSDFFPELPPIPPLPPMPPMPPLEHFYFELPYQARTAAAVDPQVSLQQEAFRSLLKISPDRALDLAAERLKTDPADPVVLANLSAISSSASTKAIPLLVSIAKTSTNLDSRRSALAAISRARQETDGLTVLEDIYKASTDSVEMRQAVVSAIGRMSDRRVANVLAGIARSDPDMSVRRAAIRALGNRNDAEVQKLLEELLKEARRPGA